MAQTRFKFTKEKDILMLREAVAVDAFGHKNGQGWKKVVGNLIKNDSDVFGSVSSRTVRDRAHLLMEQFRYTTHSGTGEVCDEYSMLLKELIQQKDDFLTYPGDRKPLMVTDLTEDGDVTKQTISDSHLDLAGLEEGSSTSINPISEDTGSSDGRRGKKRSLDSDFIDFLREREANRAREKMEELRLKKQELDQQREERMALVSLLTKLLPPPNDN